MKKKLSLLFCSVMMASALTTGVVLATATDATPEQNVTDATRITTAAELNLSPFYKTVTMQKDGTGTGEDSKTFSGLVPYGTGKIDLGTYDMSSSIGLDAPLFTIVPHKAWKTTTSNADFASTEDYYFNVNLEIGSTTITYRFANQGRTDGYNIPAVYIAKNGGAFGAQGGWSKDDATYPNTILPYHYDGTKPATAAVDDTKTTITEPTDIGFYLATNGYWHMDVGHSNAQAAETETGSGIFRFYNSCIFWVQPAAANFSSVKVSIEFDKGTVTEDEAWVTFTSIGGKRTVEEFSDPTEYLTRGDLYEVTPTANTITLNKSVYLADNDATTKLFEFETNSITGASEVKEVELTLKGATHEAKVGWVVGDDNGIQNAFSAVANSAPWHYWYIRGRDNSNRGRDYLANHASFYGRQSPYLYNGVVNRTVLDETGTAYTKGAKLAPRFAIYYDPDTACWYNDFGTDAEKTQVGSVYRWLAYDCSAVSGMVDKMNALVADGRLSVTLKVTLADGIDRTFVKLTNVDGQSLVRDTVTSANYKTIAHNYAMPTVENTETYVGAEFAIPALKDNAVLAQGGNADRAVYTVKVNSVETSEDTFTVETVGENKIEYFVGETKIGEIVLNAKPVDVTLIHRGASIRYKSDSDESQNGIRFIIAMKASEVANLDGHTVTAGVLLAGTNELDGAALTVDNAAKNVTFDIETEWAEVEVDGETYVQMVVYVHSIPETDYATAITTVGYICVDGTYIYSEAKSRSISYVAQELVNNPNTPQSVKDSVAKYIVSE